MGMAAGLSLARGFVLAAILSPPMYAVYSSIMGLGGFIANGLSFGLIENTVKKFPRLVMEGNHREMIGEAKFAAKHLCIRAVVVAILALALHFIFGGAIWKSLGVAALLALGASLASLLASIQRALFNTSALAKGTLYRAAVSVLIVSLGGWLWGLRGALFGEWLAALVGTALTLGIVWATMAKHRTHHRSADDGQTDKPEFAPHKNTGLYVFFSYTLLSVPIYLDKMLVNHVYGEALGANYAFMTLLLTVSMVVINIIAQKVGPNLIAMQKVGCSAGELLQYGMKWATAGVMVWMVFILVYITGLKLDLLPARIAKYQLEPEMIVGLFFLGVLQFSSILEYILLAFDMERKFLAWVMVFFGTTLVSGLFVTLYQPALILLPMLLIASKLVYIGGLLLEILRKKNK